MKQTVILGVNFIAYQKKSQGRRSNGDDVTRREERVARTIIKRNHPLTSPRLTIEFPLSLPPRISIRLIVAVVVISVVDRQGLSEHIKPSH